jgi:cyclopropane fatty-acyl-phospholipid synthase-like methyltransferase
MMTDWSLDIEDMSWVERTTEEVDFVVEALDLRGDESILDLACGFGRHSLELARRGYSALGVDFTEAYIAHARSVAQEEQLDNAAFLLADVRSVSFHEEFDVVLNMADGAIGYFDTDEENLKLFGVIRAALKVGGKHVMGVCSAAHAAMYFP